MWYLMGAVVLYLGGAATMFLVIKNNPGIMGLVKKVEDAVK